MSAERPKLIEKKIACVQIVRGVHCADRAVSGVYLCVLWSRLLSGCFFSYFEWWAAGWLCVCVFAVDALVVIVVVIVKVAIRERALRELGEADRVEYQSTAMRRGACRSVRSLAAACARKT